MGEIVLGRIPPQSIEAEKSVLGAILIEKDAITQVSDILKPEYFYKESHKKIYECCLSLFSDNEPIDLTTVRARISKKGFDISAFELVELTTHVNSSANIEHHARIIVESSMRRELISTSSEIVEKSFDETEDIFELVGKADSGINQIVESKVRGSYKAIGDTIIDSMMSMYENKDEDVTGVRSGFKSLDDITSGWQNGNLIILAARPAMGKTAFCVSTMLNAAKQSGIAVGFFSLEMSTQQLDERIMSSESNIPLDRIRKPKLMVDNEWEVLSNKLSKVKDYPIYIDDTAGLSIVEFKTKARRMKRNHNVSMIVVDYLQLMTGETKGNREQEIGSISRSLKGVAKELNIPIIALSQLSRAVETRGGDKKPMLSDLRESGSIEQDADLVMFLYRPEYYGILETEDGENIQGKGMVIVAKNRQGSTGEVYLEFIGKYTRWQEDNNLKQLPEIDTVSAFESESNDAPF